MKYFNSDLNSDRSSLTKVNRLLTVSYGVVILLLMIAVLVSNGLYLKGVMDREEQKLSTLLTQVLAASISRVSFSGRYHAQLLLEDTQKEYPVIRSLLITDLDGRVLASSIKSLNGNVLNGPAGIIAKNILKNKTESYSRKTNLSGEPILEITLPYRGGFDNAMQGVVQVGISSQARDQEIQKGIVLIVIMVMFLLVIGILVVRKISQYFGDPIQRLASNMSATLHAIPDLLLELDMHGRYLQVMANREELLIDSRERLLGKTVNEVMPKEAAVEVMKALDEAYKTGESHGREFNLKLADEVRWFELSVALKKNETQDIPHFIVLSRDITTRKKTEQELRDHREHLEEQVQERTISMKLARDEAERANVAKSEFLSRMSHELRTPMNAILGFGQLLELDTEELTESQQDNVKEILNAGNHLLGLINEVLDLAKIESGKMDILLQKVSINDVMQQCIPLVQPQIDANQLQLINHIDGMEYSVLADNARLKQVFLNLLSNAIKYNCPNGSITLDSKVIDNQSMYICISNTGIGLSTAEIKRLFTPFDRLHAAANIEGTGIGLVISKRLIELMGGSIDVKSSPGKETTFSLQLKMANNS